jgi:hypothetical protein
VIAINEIAGQILFSIALRRSGEVVEDGRQQAAESREPLREQG